MNEKQKHCSFVLDTEGYLHLPKEEYWETVDPETGRSITYTTARQICLHTLGINCCGPRKQYHRHGKKYCVIYRNYFGGHSDILDILVERRLMSGQPSKSEPGENYWYSFTKDGLAWMAEELGYAEIKED